MKTTCPFCGLYPYEDVDIGVGYQHVAVNCCEWGPTIFDQREMTKEQIAKAHSVAEDIEAGRITRETGLEEMHKFFCPGEAACS